MDMEPAHEQVERALDLEADPPRWPVGYQMYRYQEDRTVVYRHYVACEDGTLWCLTEVEGSTRRSTSRWRRVGRPLPGTMAAEGLTGDEAES